MIIKQIKLTNVSKDRLGRLKGKTGIKNWNVLCRWRFAILFLKIQCLQTFRL